MSVHLCHHDDLHPWECDSATCSHCRNEHDPTVCCLCWDAQDPTTESPGVIATEAARVVYAAVLLSGEPRDGG